MRVLSEETLVDALAAWGAHEAGGRLSAQVQLDPSDKLGSLNVLLHVRSPYVARIVFRQPHTTLAVELDRGDVDRLVLADGRSVASWIDDVRAGGGDAQTHFEQLTAATEPLTGPVLAVATGARGARDVGNLVLYDGWHRTAAWLERSRLGREDGPLRGHIVLAAMDDPLLLRENGEGAA